MLTSLGLRTVRRHRHATRRSDSVSHEPKLALREYWEDM
jgi:hypothetical protein